MSADFVARCRLFALRITDEAFFSGVTAARLLGVPLPLTLARDATLDVTVPAPDRAPHATGLRGHARRVPDGDVQATDGLRHSSPERLMCELATTLTLPYLVAAGDHLLAGRTPQTTVSRLLNRTRAGDRLGRTRLLRDALPLLDERAESPTESIVRTHLILAGLPRPEANLVVVARTATEPAIRVDLAYTDRMVAVEYQGDYHRDREQWRRDMARRARLEDLGWSVVELTGADLADPGAIIHRVRRALTRAGRAHSP